MRNKRTEEKKSGEKRREARSDKRNKSCRNKKEIDEKKAGIKRR